MCLCAWFHFIINGQWSPLVCIGVRTEFNVMIENLKCEAIDLLHDLGSALHLLTLEAQEALKGGIKTHPPPFFFQITIDI